MIHWHRCIPNREHIVDRGLDETAWMDGKGSSAPLHDSGLVCNFFNGREVVLARGDDEIQSGLLLVLYNGVEASGYSADLIAITT
ncbi:hypothetical protein TRIATDRAFT_298686 [Trichoderma atroviride IMI 206040]|uniref:Uncharacterized protein n=1 Tax=Hypocrea atroviridis (strain ATCC 20476 / IMI 206040) TaxID=452589 RepID=G9NNK8_HYPAI|nr:uncharacterized protein TRIATDRAFT_298686 [Trichoderma atroviride IMI 206040]EHK47652.1 hypothetical protein TRIATDRAFT_298686 [Trichoderma atroviride IMI 206040]